MQTCISSLGLTSSNYLAVLEVIENSFVGHNRTRGELSVREPTCTFERLQKHNNLNIMSISMPYFSSKTQELLAKRWKYTLKNSKKLLYCQTDNPQDFGADIEVTLDEYCNPSLDSKVLEKRNKDQVLTRYDQRALRSDPPLQDNSATPDQSSPRLVTVPQLWCWRIGPKLMLGGLSRHCPPQSKQYFGLNLNQVSEDNLDVFIGRLLSRHIDNLDRANLLGLSESIFSVFSWSIATVAEDVNKYTLSTAFGDISIDAEKKYLHEINDIREEIAMIRTVIFQQEEIWKEFTYNTWPEYWPDGENGRFKPIFEPSEAEIWREIAKPQAQLPKYQKRLEKLDDDAERVERHILVQLDLKQKHTAIKEAHTTTVMSAAIVGFTVITIIFTPLSFLASLFALPIDQFQGGPNTTYTTNYIGKWMATGELVSLAVTAAAIWIACEYFLEVRVSSTIWQWLRSLRGVPYTPRWLPQPLDSKVGEGHVSNTKSSMKTASALPTVVEGSQGTRKIETNLKWRHQLPALKLPNFRQIRKLRRQKSDNGDSSISLQEV
ncbi:hypothetical protein F4808DRAFT_291004 [Astrocystis sublimbata]|nr:hypothetical protein F4808DRAFT_291004 [Astrocystis sublimbata]